MALLMTSLLVSSMGCCAGYHGLQILNGWNLENGSDRQLDLERRTYLISTIMSSVMVFQLMSLFLFVYTADALHPLFSGAMCAAGTLNVNQFGYPLLVIKIFRVCNSPYLGHHGKINTLHDAVVYMGLKSILSIVTVHALSGFSPGNIDKVHRILHHCLMVGMIAKQISLELDIIKCLADCL